MSEPDLKAWGWAFLNSDTGNEWSPLDTHPVHSGECEDATDVQRMTLEEFQRQYPADEGDRQRMTPEERAGQVIFTIQAFGWDIRHHGRVPDDGWPIDIIAKAIRDAVDENSAASQLTT